MGHLYLKKMITFHVVYFIFAAGCEIFSESYCGTRVRINLNNLGFERQIVVFSTFPLNSDSNSAV